MTQQLGRSTEELSPIAVENVQSYRRNGTSSTHMLGAAPGLKRCRCRFPLYAQVMAGMVLGILLGWLAPEVAANPWIEALGKLFVKMVKMIIAPIIFCTVVSGIAHVADAAKVGRVALKAIVYFEVISTLALMIGLLVAEVVQPGRGLHAEPDEAAVKKYEEEAEQHSTLDFVMGIVPNTVVSAFVDGEILQVLFFSVIFGFALLGAEKVEVLHSLIDQVAHGMFGVVKIIMKFAPFGAFGAMAHTVGKYGIGTLGTGMEFTWLGGHQLRHLPLLSDWRPGSSLPLCGLQHLPFPLLPQARVAASSGHLFLRKRPSFAAGALAGSRALEASGGFSGSPGLFLQPGRHEHLHDADDPLHQPMHGR